jgi:MerR family transcriptional regulator/heat shock protein HspR
MRDILALREIQRLSQEEGVNLSGIKLLLDQHRELEQARRLIAELHAEVAQLRVELESTRAVAARLAELRRSGNDTRSGREGREGLVPVRSARVAVWEPIAGPYGESGPPRGDK